MNSEPEIGIGVTYGIGSDRYVGTIIRVSESKKTIWFRDDESKLISGSEWTGDAKYNHTLRKQGEVRKAMFRSKTNSWKVVGLYSLIIGQRNFYTDPSF